MTAQRALDTMLILFCLLMFLAALVLAVVVCSSGQYHQ